MCHRMWFLRLLSVKICAHYGVNRAHLLVLFSFQQRIFLDLKEKILKTLHSDNRSFFALNMIASLLIFYIILFRTTVWHAADAAKRVRKFVNLIPIHVLTKAEWPHIVGFFKWRKYAYFPPHAHINASQFLIVLNHAGRNKKWRESL